MNQSKLPVSISGGRINLNLKCKSWLRPMLVQNERATGVRLALQWVHKQLRLHMLQIAIRTKGKEQALLFEQGRIGVKNEGRTTDAGTCGQHVTQQRDFAKGGAA